MPNPIPSDEDGSQLWLRYVKVPIPGRLAEYQAALTHVVKAGTLGHAAGGAVRAGDGPRRPAGRDGAGRRRADRRRRRRARNADVVDRSSAGSRSAAASPRSGNEGYLVEAATVGGKRGDRRRRATPTSACCTASFALLRHLQMPPPARRPRARRARPRSSAACSTTGTTWTAPSSAATPGSRSGDGASCRRRIVAALHATTRAPTRRSASTASCSTTSTPTPQILTAAVSAPRSRRSPTCFARTASRSICRRGSARRSRSAACTTADPLDPRVAAWWADKADEIYTLIPDFGGFLVKANSEGQPGPQDYGRTHADGANMLADALGAARRHRHVARVRLQPTTPTDRVKQAYDEFKPLDGKFAPNVLRAGEERAARLPAARAVPPAVRRDAAARRWCWSCRSRRSTWARTRTSPTSGRCSRRCCESDTYAQGQGLDRSRGSSTARVHGYMHDRRSPASPTSATTATGPGRTFNQANWYAFGRLAWDPDAVGAGHRRRVDPP